MIYPPRQYLLDDEISKALYRQEQYFDFLLLFFRETGSDQLELKMKKISLFN